MELEKFYSLRKDFIILGLTGRAGAGCSELAGKLENENFISEIGYEEKSNLITAEEIKFDMCIRYLKEPKNFNPFKTIRYKDVLILHLIFECSKDKNPIDYFIKTLCQYGDGYDEYINRYGIKKNKKTVLRVKEFLDKKLQKVTAYFKEIEKFDNIETWLKSEYAEGFSNFYFNSFVDFSKQLLDILNTKNVTKRTRFLHDLAINIRKVGKCYHFPNDKCTDLVHIYTVAETINRIIKHFRQEEGGKARIVIDSLKNSLELLYFKEKYSGFYMVAINKNELERKEYISSVVKKSSKRNIKHSREIINLDDAEYKGDAVNSGDFTVPDIENCIQKSDYHIYHSKKHTLDSKNKFTNLDYQLVKLLALINQPGIITPTAIERTMQVAFNAKYNSGCISRQVGAVITDSNFSIKSIGWNDVAQNQMPCKLRNVQDLVDGKSKALFSEYERNKGELKDGNKKKKFKTLISEDLEAVNLDLLKGRTCSFCFKSFQNTYEGEKNQVHTRSLHAEENAMMQISKYGGNGLKNGYLFTTASPCELCSKKAYQLGVKKIYYIDPYPGIAMSHTLKNGINVDDNPEMLMFRGAVGRVFHKLYEPFMSHKDELKILTGFQPIKRSRPYEEDVNNWVIDEESKDKIKAILKKRKVKTK